MSNNLTANFAEIWAKEQQEVFMKKSVAMEVANTTFKSQLTSGKTFSRTYRSTNADDAPDVYTRYTDITARDITDTKEQLVVDKQYAFRFDVDNFDEIQSDYNAALDYGREYGILLQTQIDADVLGEVMNATSKVDSGDVGGTTGQGIVLSTANVLQTVTAVTKKLQSLNIYDDNKIGVVSPQFEEIISLYYGAKVTDLGDNVAQNGFFTKISGYRLHSSNNLTCSAVLALATTPTDGDTVTIKGVTFTFKTTLGSTAGNVLIGASADIARANLAALINAPLTTTSNGVALSATNGAKFLARVTATNDNTGDTLTVVYKGAGTMTVAETLTAGADVWTTTLQKQMCLFGVSKKCTTLITQKSPSVEINKAPKMFVKHILNGVLYGVKTFSDQAKQMVRVELNASGF